MCADEDPKAVSVITSYDNPKLKKVRGLMKRSRFRREEGAFVAEGIRMYREIPEELLLETYVSESFSAKHPEISGEIVSDRCFKRLSDTETPQGILAVAKIEERSLSDYLSEKEGLYVVVEGLQDPGNLGTIMRTGEAAGLKCLIADRNTVDVYSPKTVRSTMGSILRVPCVYVDDLKGTIEEMKRAGVSVYAADLKGEADFHKVSYEPLCAFLIGNEGKGLSREISDLADMKVKIPMKGKVESLNAAISAALLMYEYL